MPWRDNSDGSKGRDGMSKAFIDAVLAVVRDLGWTVAGWKDGALELTDAAGKTSTFGLENLYRRTHDVERTEWPKLIADFLTRIIAACKPDSDLAIAADRLLVRIRPYGADLNRAEELMWAMPIEGAGLAVCMVLDAADTMTYVTGQMVADSGRPSDDWIDIALTNLRKQTPARYLECLDPKTGVHLGSVGDSYDAARAMIVEELLPESPLGCLVAVPYRDCLLAQRVEKKIIPHLHLIRLLALNHFESKPYPITSEVFWIRDGVWRRLPIEIKNKQITVSPPPEFVEVLQTLMGDEAGEVE